MLSVAPGSVLMDHTWTVLRKLHMVLGMTPELNICILSTLPTTLSLDPFVLLSYLEYMAIKIFFIVLLNRRDGDLLNIYYYNVKMQAFFFLTWKIGPFLEWLKNT